jgi:predicted nuclease of predicted toxin-antitoxin system
MKLKLDENLPSRLIPILKAHGHQVDTVMDEGLAGRPDSEVWRAARAEARMLITQDLDFSDTRAFRPGTHAGILLVRWRIPGPQALSAAIQAIADQFDDWSGCFVVLTESKLRVRRPPRG